MNDEQLANLYQDKTVEGLLINQYLIIKNDKNEIIDKFRFDGTNLLKLKNMKFKNTNILKPLDDIQMCAYDSLLQETIKVVCLVGKSGTGKTKTAISIGLELIKQGLYDKLILIRQTEEASKGIGWLPGTKDEKMMNWCGCFIDNLPGDKFEFEELLKFGKIELESLSLLKGRNFKNSFIIYDECEDSYPNHIELVGSRCNDNSKLVFVGDYKQVSNPKYLKNSGLFKLIDKAKGKDWFSVVELKTNGRGKIAEFFATEYKE